MLTEKAANMIKIYPYGNDKFSIESIKNGFQWLYGTVEDETIPVSTELFRSSFNNAIHMVCSRQHSHETMDLLVYIYSRLSHEHRNVKICSNCGRYFIPLKRSDEKYCSNKSKKNPAKTCKEIGAKEKQRKAIRNNISLLAHYNTMGKLYNAIRRAKQSGEQESADYFFLKLQKERDKKL